jgi:Endonuclease-reverse transcriptase
VKESTEAEEIFLDTDPDATAVKVFLGKVITICSIYIPPRKKITKEDLIKLVRQLPKPFIISGDINAHSCRWGSRKTSPRGKIFEKIIDERNLNVANTGEGTHLIPSTGGMSAIDVTLTTLDLSPETRWFVHPDSCNSDHLPTITEFLDGITPPTKRQLDSRYCRLGWLSETD